MHGQVRHRRQLRVPHEATPVELAVEGDVVEGIEVRVLQTVASQLDAVHGEPGRSIVHEHLECERVDVATHCHVYKRPSQAQALPGPDCCCPAATCYVVDEVRSAQSVSGTEATLNYEVRQVVVVTHRPPPIVDPIVNLGDLGRGRRLDQLVGVSATRPRA